VYDYAAGKTDWLAADLPFEGTAQLAGPLTRRAVVAVTGRVPAGQVRGQIAAQGFGPAVVVNDHQVVMGAAHASDLDTVAAGVPVGQVMRFGAGTVRPSEDAAELAHRIAQAGMSRIIVTRSDGTLIGLFFASDAPSPPHR
jgi:CBS-domain-containing membrane protein